MVLTGAGLSDPSQVSSRFGLMVGVSTSCKDCRDVLNKPETIKWLSALYCRSGQLEGSSRSESQYTNVADYNEEVKVTKPCS